MNYFSKNPIQQTFVVIKSLTDYVILLADKKFHYKDLKMVHELFLINNYLPQRITKQINKRIIEICNRNNNNDDFNKDTELVNKSI